MLLAINIGNTNTVFGLFDKDKIFVTWKVKTMQNRFDKALSEEFDKRNNYLNIKGVVIGSVVPNKSGEVIEFLNNLSLPKPTLVGPKSVLPIKILVDNPEELGADIIANLTAANEFYSKPVLVVDSGTATTFCLLSNESELLGAIIAPGLEMMAKSLNENTALLPEVNLKKPDNLMGKNTIECMQSGVYWGYIDLVKGIINRIKNENKDIKIIGTGGNMPLIAQEISGIDVDPDLTLKGLKIIYDLNN